VEGVRSRRRIRQGPSTWEADLQTVLVCLNRIPKGEAAYKRLHVHLGIPDEFAKAEMEKMPDYHSSKLNHRGVTVGELAESIGWNKMGVE
jgi:hypothetical protein